MARRRRSRTHSAKSITSIPAGGGLQPLSSTELAQVIDSAHEILERVGMAGLPRAVVESLQARGALTRGDMRVCFPRAMVEDALARAPSTVSVPGLDCSRTLEIGGGRVHIGTGGAAVQVLDAANMKFRDSSLNDLYLLMRVVDTLANIHYGVRPVVARDVIDPIALDLNTAFACLKATTKPVGVSFHSAHSVEQVVALCDQALGTRKSFQEQPFCMGVVVHVVPPLRFATDAVDVIKACVHNGVIPQICSAGQAGATSPVTLAGALAQGLAETLAGLMLVDLFKPGAPCIYAFMPFISDLRTGAMSGGSGECAVANAAAAQLLRALNLPSTVSAGMTDAKLADVQAGYEKGYSVALAAHAGADMINLSVGMLGSIMVASPEMMVIDNDMCGAILRSVEGIDVSDETLNIEMIERVVTGEGHYLGEPETLARMKTDYVYPSLGDRSSVAEWQDAGAPALWDHAVLKVNEIAGVKSTHLATSIENQIRNNFPIQLKQ